MRYDRITDLDNGLIIPGLPRDLQHVPTERAAWEVWRDRVLVFRTKVREAALRDDETQNDVWKLCASDPVFFCLIFGIIYDPRWKGTEPPGWRPWILYPYQVEFLRWVMATMAKSGPRGHGIAEKARDMGVSWLCCLIGAHFFLFAEAGDVGYTSRNQDEVDKRSDQKSLFTKIRSLLGIDIVSEHKLPDWLFPKGFQSRRHDKEMLLSHPSKAVTIMGFATTKNTARGARATIMFNDEAAFNLYHGGTRSSQVSVTDHIFDVGSAGLDDGGAFKAEAEQAVAAKANPSLPGSSHIRIDWWIHPYHDQQWYLDKKAEMNDAYAFAREIEIDYMAGVGSWVYPRAQRYEVGSFPYVPTGGPLYCVIDPGLHDPTAVLYAQYLPAEKRLRIVKALLIDTDLDARFVASVLLGKVISGPDGYSREDYAPYMDFMDWVRTLRCTIEYVGDPYGNTRGGDGSRTFYESLSATSHDLSGGRNVIVVMWNFDQQANTYRRRMESANIWLPRTDFDDDPGVAYFLTALQQARFADARGNTTREQLEPKHDWTSHYRSTYEYLAVDLELDGMVSSFTGRDDVVIANLGGITQRDERAPQRERPDLPAVRDDRLQLHAVEGIR